MAKQSFSKKFRIGLLATGNELTEGDILNLDGQAISKTLQEQGLPIGLHVITPDQENDIKKGLNFLLQSHTMVIITGGLGPTSDDITRNALTSIIGKELKFDETSWQHICQRIHQRLGREPHESNRQQAFFPEGAHIIPNPNGTAAGCWVEYKKKTIYMLPGPPKECIPMFLEVVLPDILSKHTPRDLVKLSWRLQGAIESDMAALIDEAVKNYPVITGYRAEFPFLEVKIYSTHHAEFDEMLAIVKKIIEPYLS